MVIIIIIQ